MSDELILSVVEELDGIQSSQFLDDIFDPEFWLNFIPFRYKKASKTSDAFFTYEFEETFLLDPTATLTYDLYSKGSIEVLEDKKTDNGRFWRVKVTSEEPEAIAFVNIRLKDTKSGVKVGFYLYELHLDFRIPGCTRIW